MQKTGNKIFDIVIPTLNEESHLPNLLGDLRAQTFRNFNVIVVDGKSEDKTKEIIKKYKVKLIISSRRNVSYQRNLGAEESKAEWIVFMDADNRIPKRYLENVYKYLNTHSPDLLSTWIKPDTGSNKDKLTATIMNLFMDLNKNSKKPYILESMFLIKNSCFKKLKGFNPKTPWGEGEELLGKAKKAGMTFDFVKNPKYTYSFRRLKKIGAFKMLQEMSQMEIVKALKGNLTKKETEFLYPMKGGAFYKNGSKKKLTLKKFISILFE